jgi:NADPH2:quinone reductase
VVAGTTYAMLKKIARLHPKESILIHSASGAVGTTALQLAKYMGAFPIFATVGNDAKKTLPADLGADPVFNYRSEDYVKRVLSLTDGRGVDVIMNPLAGEILERDLDCLADFGRLICYGNAGGSAATIQSDQLHGSCRSVLGFSFGNMRRSRPEAAAEIMQSVISLISEGRIRMLIGKRFALRDAAKAHQFLESRTSTGKILLTFND